MRLPSIEKIRHCLVKGIRTIFAALMLAGVSVLPAHAVEVAGLYEVALPVASQQASERKDVSRIGLERVIQRISGSTKALLDPGVQAALRTPERYLQEFSYFVAVSEQPEEAQRLRLQFDSALVNRLLREAKQPIWGSNRPNLIVWVAIENAGRRSVLSADDSSTWLSSIQQAGKDTGLPLLLPLMDLQDDNNISVMDVWGLFPDKLESASQRYHAEVVLGGRVYQDATNRWEGRWLLVFGGAPVSFTTQAGSSEQVASDAMAYVANILSSHYAIDTTRELDSILRLSVEGIDSLMDYANLTAYLEGFAVVRNVAVSTVDGDRMTLVLTTESDWQTLKELIALDQQLMPLPDAVTEFEGGVMVIPYAWRP